MAQEPVKDKKEPGLGPWFPLVFVTFQTLFQKHITGLKDSKFFYWHFILWCRRASLVLQDLFRMVFIVDLFRMVFIVVQIYLGWYL